jgi:hypothetical protein
MRYWKIKEPIMGQRSWKDRSEDALKHFRGIMEYDRDCPVDSMLTFREIVKASQTPYDGPKQPQGEEEVREALKAGLLDVIKDLDYDLYKIYLPDTSEDYETAAKELDVLVDTLYNKLFGG